MKSLAFLGAALLSLSAASALAQPVDLTLTLDDALTRAVAASHRLEEAAARQEAADANIAQRKAAQMPQVSAQAGYTRTNHVEEFGILLPNNQLRVIYPDVPDNYRTRLDVSMPAYTGGRLQALERAARQEQAATVADREAMRGDIRLDTERAFWTLVMTDEQLRVVTQSRDRVAAHLANVRNALDAGLVPPNDVLSAEAQEARQRMLIIQATSARQSAEAELARLIGADVGVRINAVSSSNDSVVDQSIEPLIREALDRRKERQALALRQSAAGERVTAAAAGMRPSIFVGGGVDYARPNPRIFPREAAWKTSWDASVNVSWPLFDGGRTKADSAEAVAGGKAIAARIAEFDSLVALDIQQRLAELTASRAAVDAADASLRAATEALRVVTERYAAGVAISSDMLDAQSAVLQAELDRAQATVTGHIAAARLRRAVGR